MKIIRFNPRALALTAVLLWLFSSCENEEVPSIQNEQINIQGTDAQKITNLKLSRLNNNSESVDAYYSEKEELLLGRHSKRNSKDKLTVKFGKEAMSKEYHLTQLNY